MAVVLAGTITSIVNRSPVRYVPETPRPPCSARSCARLARRRITDTLRDMSDRIGLLGTARNLLLLLWGVLGYVLRFLWLLVLPKAALVAKLMALGVSPLTERRRDGWLEKRTCVEQGS